MSVIEVFLAVFIVADIVINGLALLLLRDVLHTRTMRESVRRQWEKGERDEPNA